MRVEEKSRCSFAVRDFEMLKCETCKVNFCAFPHQKNALLSNHPHEGMLNVPSLVNFDVKVVKHLICERGPKKETRNYGRQEQERKKSRCFYTKLAIKSKCILMRFA
jgi:hypothetical protein